ncbi:MAG: tRNA (N6-threonylcarbamoyladenosine(37)-N6)-methyltransferase TrmO [Syntrophomonadaceae bacterium]|jgi:tRNA-Thr(GGU) m(6)t(6)A37 methyltransferase TsaA|nr:tRNA (N6-threonylcarbamoyladenosine(37)-N6)-methyltransferase TrmO [Syntrophomonadaceae bacterium]
MEAINFRPIGYIHSPFKTKEGSPRQSIHTPEVEAIIDIKPEFSAGLLNLELYSHIIVLFHFHLSPGYDLVVERPRGDRPGPRGVFSTRSPNRPNGIGLSIVELVKIEGARLRIRGVDMLDGTPVLDIKPYDSGLNPAP